MIVLNPLLLVVTDGDVFSCCHTILYTSCVNNVCGWRGPVSRSLKYVCEMMTALYPSLLCYSVASLLALLLEEGDLAPASS
jgi:hypothetical protein